MKGSLFEEFFKFVKFGITGVMNTVVDFAVFMLLSYLGLNAYLAQTVSYSCGMLNSYIVNRSWTFKGSDRFFSRQMIRFIIANLLLLLCSVVLLWVFTEKMSFSKIVAKLFATAIIMAVGFIVNRVWVFKKR